MKNAKENEGLDSSKIQDGFKMMREVMSEGAGGHSRYEYREMRKAMEDVMFKKGFIGDSLTE